MLNENCLLKYVITSLALSITEIFVQFFLHLFTFQMCLNSTANFQTSELFLARSEWS